MNGVEGLRVADRVELLESALDVLVEGAVLTDVDGVMVFWNRAAEMMTGYRGNEVIGRPVRQLLDFLVVGGAGQWVRLTDLDSSRASGSVIRIRHALGYELPILARVNTLRDAAGTRIGSQALFHPADNIDALPRGESSDDASISESQTQLEDRLARLHEDFDRCELPLGVLWVMVDQAAELRRSHGSRACEAMLETVERTVASGLKPTEEIGRWGADEFLVLSHEHNAAALARHAQILAGLARTAEFRWWGDRISLTVSIGAAQAERGEALSGLLERAQSAMLTSIRVGGNHISAAQGKG
jgi:PAS domain S-box-containing protein/diguanylate cyclase (GGDEF)-like protein